MENCNEELDECGYTPPPQPTAQQSIDQINIIAENAFERMFSQSESSLLANLGMLDSTNSLLENAEFVFTAAELEALEQHAFNLDAKNVDYDAFWVASSASVEQNAEDFAFSNCGVSSGSGASAAQARCRTEAIEALSRVLGIGFGAGAIAAGAVGPGATAVFTSWLGYSQAFYNMGYCMHSR